MRVILSVTFGVALGLIVLGIGVLFLLRDPLSAALSPARTAPEVSLQQTQLVKKYIYAEKDFFLRVPGKEPRFFGILEAERLYLNSGRCSAGVDYTRQNFELVERNERSVFIRIPQPELFPCYFLEPGQLWDGNGLVVASTELSNQLSAVAFAELQTRAKATDLLDKARSEALDQAELDMYRLGFEKARVEFRSDPP